MSPWNIPADQTSLDDMNQQMQGVCEGNTEEEEDRQPSDDAPVKAPATTSEKPVVRPPVTTVISQKPTINKPKTNSDGSYVVPVIRGNNK